MSGLLPGVVLKLFVAGNTVRSERAIAQARRLCERELPAPCELVVVDILEEPWRAEEARILATPTLIKDSPPPTRRIIGDLDDTGRVVAALGLQAAPAAQAIGERK